MAADAWTTLSTWGQTSLGAVTGNNRYFAMSLDRARELGLTAKELIGLSPPGSSHLRGLALTEVAMRELGDAGRSTVLFRPAGDPSAAAQAYIAAGEKLGVDSAYKCRARSPWWRVPVLAPPDLFLTYMNADSPRLCANQVGVRHLNSVHGVYVDAAFRRDAKDFLPLAAINSMTLLAAETVGRAYGGGMLKLEPREADVLPVPSPHLVRQCADDLRKLMPAIGQQLRGGALTDVAAQVDEVLLVDGLGLPRKGVRALRDQQAILMARRQARGRAVPVG